MMLGRTRRWTRAQKIVGSVVAGVVGVAIALGIPTTRRRLANPAGAVAQVGVTTVLVEADTWQNHRFGPSVVQVPVNTTITWSFVDRGSNRQGEAVEHNVVGTGWASSVQATGTFQHTFTQPGVYTYMCTLYGGMDGVIEVVGK